MNRLTSKQLKELTDRELLIMIVSERKNKLTNPNTPLYRRLSALLSKLEKNDWIK